MLRDNHRHLFITFYHSWTAAWVYWWLEMLSEVRWQKEQVELPLWYLCAKTSSSSYHHEGRESEEESVLPACPSAYPLSTTQSQGQSVTLWFNTITAGAWRLQQLVTGWLPVQIHTPTDCHPPPSSPLSKVSDLDSQTSWHMTIRFGIMKCLNSESRPCFSIHSNNVPEVTKNEHLD